MNPETVFFNRAKYLRSGWRFLIFQLVTMFFGGLIGFPLLFLLSQIGNEEQKNLLSYAVPGFALLVSAILAGWLCGKFLEERPFRALGCSFTKNWLKDFVCGLVIGAVTLLFAALVAWVFGGMRLEFNHAAGSPAILSTLGISLLIFFLAAAGEEAYFRGYILQTFTRANLAWVAILYTSLHFSYAHFNNQGVTTTAKINTIIAGVWFALAYLKTRNLWFPFGIHLAWNWVLGAVLGIPVSGITEITRAPLFVEIDKGAEVLTGGNYGIEGGIACTLAIVLSSALIYFLPFLKPTEEMLLLTSEESLSKK